MNINSAKRIAIKIRNDHGRPNWPMPIKYIGGGADGKVYLTETGKLMKVTFAADPMEFRGLAKLQGTGFVPSFNKRNWIIMGKSKRGTKVTAFLMGKIGDPGDKVQTFKNFLRGGTDPYMLKSQISNMIRTMHMHGVSHGNLHEDNILVVTTPSGMVKPYIIDFGRAVFFPVGQTERQHYLSMQPKGWFPTGNTQIPIPLFSNSKGIPRRMNVNMSKVLYKNIPRSNEHHIRKLRSGLINAANAKKRIASNKNKKIASNKNTIIPNALGSLFKTPPNSRKR